VQHTYENGRSVPVRPVPVRPFSPRRALLPPAPGRPIPVVDRLACLRLRRPPDWVRGNLLHQFQAWVHAWEREIERAPPAASP
jgi:hypothetical protein